MGRHSTRASVAQVEDATASRRLLSLFLVLSALATLIGLTLTWPDREQIQVSDSFQASFVSSQKKVPATVTAIEEGVCGSPAGPVQAPSATPAGPETSGGCRTAAITITGGDHEGMESELIQFGVAGEPILKEGDRIRVIEGPPAAGAPAATTGTTAGAAAGASSQSPTWAFADYQRSQALIVWAIIIVAAIVIMGALRGLRSLLGLLVSFAIVGMYLLPGLLRGGDPVVLAILTAAAIIFSVVFLVHGLNWKSASAIGGTVIALLIASTLAKLAIETTQIQGFGDEDNLKLMLYLPDVTVPGVMMCGFVIGSIGALNDVAVAQSSTVNELNTLEPGTSRWKLFLAGMRVGQDHVASMVYTLVLTYVGAALPLLLLLTAAQRPLMETLTSDVFTTELIRSGVGALGLILTVPLTTLIAAWTVGRDDDATLLRS